MEVARGPSQEDRLRRQRAFVLLASAGAFALWQISDVLRPFAGDRARALAALSFSGAVGWMVLLAVGVWLARRMAADRAVERALQDERIVSQRTRAWFIGFWAIVSAQCALLVASALGARLPLGAGARLTIVVGVVATIVAFLLQDRD